jgi:hypothetical protein
MTAFCIIAGVVVLANAGIAWINIQESRKYRRNRTCG